MKQKTEDTYEKKTITLSKHNKYCRPRQLALKVENAGFPTVCTSPKMNQYNYNTGRYISFLHLHMW